MVLAQNIYKENHEELLSLCNLVRELTDTKQYEQCRVAIASAMEKYPNAPEPHNLYGVLFEKIGDHVSAMKHFRAAWALDPTYIPARHNMNLFGAFNIEGKCAYDESDCAPIRDRSNK